MNNVLVICGPTATGKTALAASLAEKIHGELVSADSRQVYKGMDIGTGKDLPQDSKDPITYLHIDLKNTVYTVPAYDLGRIPIWLLDVVHPNEDFSISHYTTIAQFVIADILKRKKTPIIVGGTGQYIDALFHPPESIHIPPNPTLRATLLGKSVQELQTKLRMVDDKSLETMNNSDKNNPRRLIRKIEIALSDGSVKPYDHSLLLLKAKYIGLTMNPIQLYRRIDARVDARVSGGIIDEIQHLIAHGFTWDLRSMSGLGYREWKSYFEDGETEHGKQQAIQQWKFDEHAYARRQMTWFKKNTDISWFDVLSEDFTSRVTKDVLAWYTKK